MLELKNKGRSTQPRINRPLL